MHMSARLRWENPASDLSPVRMYVRHFQLIAHLSRVDQTAFVADPKCCVWGDRAALTLTKIREVTHTPACNQELLYVVMLF